MIRRILATDRQLYLTFAEEFYASPAVLHAVPHKHLEDAFNEMVSSSPYLEGFFLCDENEPVGYAILAKTYSQEAGGIVIWIEKIYLRERARGKGLGKEFFTFVETLGAARLRLEAEPDNERAIKLYRSLGFTPLPYLQFIKKT